jgi:4-amino-4-deoxy-L-arabinose transferase-like glycosyltransferase
LSTNAVLIAPPNLAPPHRLAPYYTALLTLLGFALRLVLLDRFPLREDEAIYGYWALHAWFEDPNFLTVWPDKPPIFLWLLSGTVRAFGSDAAGARLLNIGVSTLTIPVVATTAQRLWGQRASVGAALVMALSPFAISFAPTVFTDPLLVFCGSLAFLLAVRGHAGWAGLWLGAAIMTKQQGLLYLPLIAGVLLLRPTRGVLRTQLALLGGLLLAMLPVIYWDSLRWHVAPSPWDLGARNYGGLALAQIAQWPARLSEWQPLLWELTASWAVWLWLVVLLLLGQLSPSNQLVETCHTPHLSGRSTRRLAATAPAWSDVRSRLDWSRPTPWRWILWWSGGFLLFHVVTTVAVWDRYLLPLTPIVALLLARLLVRALDAYPLREQSLIVLATVLFLLPPAWNAAQGGRPVGGDHGDYAGYTETIAWLEDEASTRDAPAAVLYHQRMGWHHHFYLYTPLRAGRYELRWFPSAVYLADNAVKTPARPLYYIAPEWETVRDLPAHLARRGVSLEPRFRAGKMTVYELMRPPVAYCAWCLSQPSGSQPPDN